MSFIRICMFWHWHSCAAARFLRGVVELRPIAWRHRDPEGSLPLSSRCGCVLRELLALFAILTRLSHHTSHSYHVRP
eukprot:5734157-Pleurochrysis_carterae.AAC.1